MLQQIGPEGPTSLHLVSFTGPSFQMGLCLPEVKKPASCASTVEIGEKRAPPRRALKSPSSNTDPAIKRELPQKKRAEVYTRTATPVTIHYDSQTKVVMGPQTDIHSGAVVHVTGIVQHPSRTDRGAPGMPSAALAGELSTPALAGATPHS